jgi:hypothetical protein
MVVLQDFVTYYLLKYPSCFFNKSACIVFAHNLEDLLNLNVL